MYRCEKCDSMFLESGMEYLRDSEFGLISVCPYCNSEEITEVKRCDHCGKWTSADELFEHEGICANCASNTLKELTSLILTKFSHPQILFIRELVDEAILK